MPFLGLNFGVTMFFNPDVVFPVRTSFSNVRVFCISPGSDLVTANLISKVANWCQVQTSRSRVCRKIRVRSEMRSQNAVVDNVGGRRRLTHARGLKWWNLGEKTQLTQSPSSSRKSKLSSSWRTCGHRWLRSLIIQWKRQLLLPQAVLTRWISSGML